MEMEQMLIEFVNLDEISRAVILEQIIERFEKFFLALQYTTIPNHQIHPLLYTPEETIKLIEEQPLNIIAILERCKSKTFLNNLNVLNKYTHPMISKFRFVKPRDLNKVHDKDQYFYFPFPKNRVILFFKFKILWYIGPEKRTNDRNNLKKIAEKLDNNLNVLEVCYDRKGDDITHCQVVDLFYFSGKSFLSESFEYRYNYLKSLNIFHTLPNTLTTNTTDKYLVKKKTDNIYDRTEWILNLIRLKVSLYLLIGEIEQNKKTRVYVAKFDHKEKKFNVIGCTTKKMFPTNKLDFVQNGLCIFGNEYIWSCKQPTETPIKYYKNPFAAKIALMSSKINMRSSIQNIIYPPPRDTSKYI